MTKKSFFIITLLLGIVFSSPLYALVSAVDSKGYYGPYTDTGYYIGHHLPQTNTDKKIQQRGHGLFVYGATNRMEWLSQYGFKATYVFAGLGLMGLVIFAFMGKFRWSWLAALLGGLVIMAGFQSLIQFIY
ncbi:MAG: hypothetical protein ACTSXQ_07060 [Alphaproteobacteria bacterium]